jgi:SSS family solute:Na+ symporter
MNTIAIISFVFFTGLVAVISWKKTRRQKADTLNSRFLANRSLGFLFAGGALLFANINTATIIGENELVYTNNMTVIAWGLTSVFAMLIVSEFFMPIYLRTGISTTPDYLEARYDSSTKKMVSLIFLISYLVNLLPSVLYAGAVAFNGLFHFSATYKIDYWTTIWILIWIMGATGGIYSILGGLRAIAVSDALLGLGIFAGGILLPFFGLKYLGHGNVGEGLHLVLSSKKEHLNSIGSAADPIPFPTLFTGMLLVNLYYWGTEQYIVQQVLASRDLKTCQKAIALACGGKLISPLLLNIPGLIAVHLFTASSHTAAATTSASASTTAATLATTATTLSTATATAATTAAAASTTTPITLSNSAEVFPALASLVSPPFIAGYIAAIVFGAGLTTFNAGLNSSGTLFILNFYKPWLQKNGRPATERDLIRAAKRFELFACLAAMFIAPFIVFARRGFYTYVQTVNGFFNVPILTIIFIGFLTRRVPPIAAKVGLWFFIICYGASQLLFTVNLHFLHVLAILFILTSLLMLAIGKRYPMPVPYQQKLNNLVDIQPWKNRHIAAGMLLLLMVGIFFIFSRSGLAK